MSQVAKCVCLFIFFTIYRLKKKKANRKTYEKFAKES